MKLIPLIRPVSKSHREDIEEKLDEEIARFQKAAREAIQTFRRELSPEKLIRRYPLQTAAVVVFGGMILTRVLASSRRRRHD